LCCGILKYDAVDKLFSGSRQQLNQMDIHRQDFSGTDWLRPPVVYQLPQNKLSCKQGEVEYPPAVVNSFVSFINDLSLTGKKIKQCRAAV
jgi:hypothetical protein